MPDLRSCRGHTQGRGPRPAILAGRLNRAASAAGDPAGRTDVYKRQEKDIEVGIETATQYEVISGLEEGDIVILE